MAKYKVGDKIYVVKEHPCYALNCIAGIITALRDQGERTFYSVQWLGRSKKKASIYGAHEGMIKFAVPARMPRRVVFKRRVETKFMAPSVKARRSCDN